MISKRLHPASFSNVNAQLAQNAYYHEPIYSYTVSGNKEVITTAVDLGTGVFTAVGHGFTEGQTVIPVLNSANSEDYPLKYMPTGLTPQRYYIKYLTVDTFAVAITNGGSAVTFTSNGTQDLSKWHFEKYLISVLITSLPTLTKAKIIVNGSLVRLDQILPYVNTYAEYATSTYLKSGVTTINNSPSLSLPGAVANFLEYVIDCTKGLMLEAKGYRANFNSAVANILTQTYAWCFDPAIALASFTKIALYDGYILNGTKIEVYKV